MPGGTAPGVALDARPPRRLLRRLANASFTLDPALIDRPTGAPHPF